VAGKAWTTGRKFLGNVLPLALSLPFLVLGAAEAAERGPSRQMYIWLVLFFGAGWLATALFGTIGNGALREAIGKRLHHARGFDQTEKRFVGFATPAYKGLFDPHEDVGFLILHPDRLEFFGDSQQVTVRREHIERVRLRPNIHSWLFLGGWVSVEGTRKGAPIRLLIEARESSAQIVNALRRRPLRDRLQRWLEETPTSDDRAQTLDNTEVPEDSP